MLPARIPARLVPTLTLKRHQLEAVAFVHRALQSDDGFVILADDMGMGKTLVAMQAMIDVLHQEEEGGAVLVLTSRVILEEVWRPHLRRYAPSARVHVVGGEPETRVRDLQQAMATQHVVLCTATMAGALHVRSHAWAAATAGARLVVVDECQYMTNPDSQLWQAVHARNDTPTLLMSGTPFHNQPARQLRALCRAGAAPGAALGQSETGMLEFLVLWEQKRAGLLLQRTRAELAGRDASMHRPPLREQREVCTFSPQQARLYHQAHAAMMARFQALQRARGAGNVLGTAACLRAYQAALTTLRVAGTHPCISDVSRGDMQASAVARRHARTKRGISAKLHMALRFIRAQGVKLGRKVVVVSAFRCFLDILAEYLLDRNISFVRSRAPCAAPCAPPSYRSGRGTIMAPTCCS